MTLFGKLLNNCYRFRKKSLYYLNLLNPFATVRTKEILQVNPTIIPQRLENNNIKINVYESNAETLDQQSFDTISKCPDLKIVIS